MKLQLDFAMSVTKQQPWRDRIGQSGKTIVNEINDRRSVLPPRPNHHLDFPCSLATWCFISEVKLLEFYFHLVTKCYVWSFTSVWCFSIAVALPSLLCTQWLRSLLIQQQNKLQKGNRMEKISKNEPWIFQFLRILETFILESMRGRIIVRDLWKSSSPVKDISLVVAQCCLQYLLILNK
jgi:hypothetical protein